MQFIIADTLQASLAKLDPTDQGTVKQAVFDFQAKPDNPGFQFHRLNKAKDKGFWSARVSQDLRLIIYKDAQYFVLCFAAHHDDAYRWAERRRFSINDTTGAAQFVTTEERVEEIVRVVERVERTSPAIFAKHDEDYLLQLGVPRDWLPVVKQADEDMFLSQLAGELPEEAYERLMMLALGEPVPVPPRHDGKDPFQHPDARRRFQIVEGDGKAAMQRALDAPWDKWVVFLHPSQREAVERDYSGPARVTGGAGTGKTVVALHRAANLARANPDARVLLTTFSKTLAKRLEQNLDKLLPAEGGARQRIVVTNVHNLAAEIWRTNREEALRVLSRSEELRKYLARAAREVGTTHLFSDFLVAEWTEVVDTEGLRSWDDYKVVSRAGRGVALGVRQRKELWDVFERMHAMLDDDGVTTWPRLAHQIAEIVRGDVRERFDHVIADEVQDFGPPELHLLRALVEEGPNDLFVVGDMGQRIYKGRTSFLGAGVDIRGRSSVLRVNYRTTEQIRRHADRILPDALADGDGEEEDRRTVSLMSGPEPQLRFTNTVNDELEAAAAWLKKRLAEQYAPHEMAIFVRTNKLARDRAAKVVKMCGLQHHELSDEEEPKEKRVSIGTMHRAKGLEFKVVLVMGCEDKHVPYQFVLSKQSTPGAREAFVEQEKNLLYVACTRARERLFVSGAGAPTRFLVT